MNFYLGGNEIYNRWGKKTVAVATDVDVRLVQVPEGHFWVAGDNVDWSRDSRDYGPLPMALIVGKTTAKMWPLSQAKWLEGGFRNVES